MQYGVVPAGGLGTRSGLTHSKELSAVAGVPVIEYIFDRLVISGITHIFVTLAPDKTDLIDYLVHVSPHSSQLILRVGPRRGLLDGLVTPATELSPSDELYFGLPDTVWYPEDAYRAVQGVHSEVVLGALPSDTPQLYGSVTVKAGLATDIIEKPKHPRSPWIWAFGKFRVRVVSEFLDLANSTPVFTNVLGSYARAHQVPVVTFAKGKYFDTGTPAALQAANHYVQK